MPYKPHPRRNKLLLVTLLFGLCSTGVGFAQTASTQQSAGIWTVSSSSNECRMVGSPTSNMSIILTANLSAPSEFKLDIVAQYPSGTPPQATLVYGPDQTQVVHGVFAAANKLQVLLGSTQLNNFQEFLHGFTSGTEMSVTVGRVAATFNLTGTSAMTGTLGQCTVADGFNSLPPPWRPASEQAAATLAPTPSSAIAGHWSFPSDWALWVGKYTSDRVKGITFFEIPQVKTTFLSSLDNTTRAKLDQLGVQSPITRQGQWIVASGCMPHDCPDSNYILAISDDANKYMLCLNEMDDSQNQSTITWYATGKTPIKEEFPASAGAQCGATTNELDSAIAVDNNSNALPGSSASSVTAPEPSTPAETNQPESNEAAAAAASPIPVTTVDGVKFSDFKTGWLIGVPADDDQTICVPYVMFTATNMTSDDIDGVTFYADYMNPSEQTTFGAGEVFWTQSGDLPPLPPNYHRKVSIKGTVGIVYGPGTCSSLPNIDFNLRYQASFDAHTDSVVHGSVDPNSSTFYDPGDPDNPATVSH